MAHCSGHVLPHHISLGIRCDHSLLLDRGRAQERARSLNLASLLRMEGIRSVEKVISHAEKNAGY